MLSKEEVMNNSIKRHIANWGEYLNWLQLNTSRQRENALMTLVRREVSLSFDDNLRDVEDIELLYNALVNHEIAYKNLTRFYMIMCKYTIGLPETSIGKRNLKKRAARFFFDAYDEEFSDKGKKEWSDRKEAERKRIEDNRKYLEAKGVSLRQSGQIVTYENNDDNR